MNHIAEINGFERWLETHHLPTVAQLLWYKLLYWRSRSGWPEWTQVDNRRLMVSLQIAREASLTENRDRLVNAGLVEYQKGRKGVPGRYRLISLCNSAEYTYNLKVQPEVYSVVQSVDIINNKKKQKQKRDPDGSQEKPTQKYPTGSFEMRCVERLVTALREQLPRSRIPETPAAIQKWAKEIDQMKKLDGRSEAEIQEALDYAITDSFWQINIRSTAKLREKYETLILQARQKRSLLEDRGGREVEVKAWEGHRDYYGQYLQDCRSKKEGSGRKTKNRFHNLESHGYDYDSMVWGMMEQPGREESIQEAGRGKE